jgi:hypothetical protein
MTFSKSVGAAATDADGSMRSVKSLTFVATAHFETASAVKGDDTFSTSVRASRLCSRFSSATDLSPAQVRMPSRRAGFDVFQAQVFDP